MVQLGFRELQKRSRQLIVGGGDQGGQPAALWSLSFPAGPVVPPERTHFEILHCK